MGIRIFNTLTNNKEDFMPLRDKEVTMYVCGPTVYDEPHIGHARSAYIFDVIRRYFIYKGYKVKFVRNVTDVDDKIINKAREEFECEELKDAVDKVSLKYLDSYHKAMDGLGIMPPDEEPKATRYIEKMKDFIAVLIQRGMAYEAGGDVYFDVRKAKDYGKLSQRTVEGAEDAVSRIDEDKEKKNKGDFCLWKFSKPGEPSWDFKTGKYLGVAGPAFAKASAGKPGWHIEDTAIAEKFLGQQYDIHGGAKDLIFPHHEAEIAQMEAISGKAPMAKYWLHTGFLTVQGGKMAKSENNFITIQDFLKQHSARILRFLVLKNHYRSPIDYTENTCLQVEKELTRIDEFVAKLQSQIKSELKLANNIQKSMSKNLEAKKMLFSILEDEDALFNGNLWWLQDLNPDMILVLMAKVITSGVPAAMVSGYVLGEMNGLKNKAEISLRPSEVLRHLNWGLNDIFKNTGVTVNAWYGVFNAGARKVCFSNANHPDPFLIGPEQQVSNLIIEGNKKGESLGVNLNSVYRETSSFIPVGSRLVICTQNLLEQAAKVGERYDQTWFPQILETLGTLSLSEMRTTLENILSENKNGTSVKPSRLALLLEMPS